MSHEEEKGMQASIMQVAIGIIKNESTREVLLAWRDASKHQGGCYEFPGGKVDTVETPRAALERELREEINISVKRSKKLTTLTYDYPEKTVMLHVFLVTEFVGEPQGAEGQDIAWVSVDTLPTIEFPAANVPLVRMARLEPIYYITHEVAEFLDSKASDSALPSAEASMVSATERWLAFYTENLPLQAQCYVRDKSLSHAAYKTLVSMLSQQRSDVQIIEMYKHCFHMASSTVISISMSTSMPRLVTGVHLTHSELMACDQLDRIDDDSWFIASCHDAESIKKANQLAVDAITISPVQLTETHPDAQPLGWEAFFELSQQANCPVYALGGMTPEDKRQVLDTDVLGLAGIRHFLPC